MRICIVAEHASYRFGGEAALPMHYFSRLRQRGLDVWLVVHARTRPEMVALFPDDQNHLRFIEDRWFHKLIFRLSRFLPRRIADSTLGLLNNLLTQHLQRRVVRELIAQESIELIHQPIPVSPRFPSLMAKLGVPVVIGPMNGGMEYPPAFRHAESLFSRASIRIGRSFSNAGNSLLPGKKLAKILLVANERTRKALPACVRGEVIELPENGVDLETWQGSQASPGTQGAGTERARFVFIGRLVDWKGVDMVIEALRRVPSAELEIVGEGSMRAAWQQLARHLGVADRVIFSGWLSQDLCAARLHSATALVLPSIYECGGAVVLEAMAAGVAVIATNWGGPADYVTDTCGFLVDPASREAVIEGFAQAMEKLLSEPELASQMGISGRKRVELYFDWGKKVDRILDIYSQALSCEPQNAALPVVAN